MKQCDHCEHFIFDDEAEEYVCDAGGAFDWISSLILLVILVIASTPYPKKLLYKLWEKYDAPVRAVTAILCLFVFFIAVAYLVNSSYNPFLYYRF